MKLLVLCSALDLTLEYGGTSLWWQLFRAFYDLGIHIVTTTYRGTAVSSPWWTSYENPVRWQGYLVAQMIKVKSRLSSKKPVKKAKRSDASRETLQDQILRQLALYITRPILRTHLASILDRELDVDAILFVNVPPNQLVGLPTFFRTHYHLPVILYDQDVPASLPRYQGFATGFKIYPGADLGEYDRVVCTSIGSLKELEALGARNPTTIFCGADPEIFKPLDGKDQDIDVFFYGFGDRYREEAMEMALAEPSRRLPSARFFVAGTGFHIDLGRCELGGLIPTNRLSEFCARSKISLNIVRRAHASVYGSASARLFELASMGCCIVSTPYSGVEEWFEPGKELFVVTNADEATELYKWLLGHEAERTVTGERARARVMREHTYHHRAKQWLQVIEDLLG